MRKPIHERLAAAERRQAKAAADVAAIKARKKVTERKRDNRRKIIVGALVLVEMEREPKFAAYVRTMLAKAVTRPNDLEVVADLIQPVEAKAPASNTNTRPDPAPAAAAAAADVRANFGSLGSSFPVTVREKVTG